MKQKNFILKKSAFALILIIVMAAPFGCTKDKQIQNQKTEVTVQIDYLGTGGYYNDDIAGVPQGLIVGSNGPYTVDPNKTYNLEYQANSSFPVLKKSWTSTTGSWKIHCYVQGNSEYLSVAPF